MSLKVKSQLDLYMEELEGIDEGVIVFEHARNDGFAVSENSLLLELVRGIVSDIAWILRVINPYNTIVVRLGDKTISDHSIARRCLLFLATSMYVTFRVKTAFRAIQQAEIYNRDQIFVNLSFIVYETLTRFVDRIVLFVLVVAVALPITVGVLLWCMQCKYYQKLLVSKRATECIVGVIKRIQLVHMGGSIVHPLPPISKLEGRLLSQRQREANPTIDAYPDSMLSCIEMRRHLGSALLAVLQVHCETVQCAELSQEVEDLLGICAQHGRECADSTPTLLHLERLTHGLFDLEGTMLLDKYIAAQLCNAYGETGTICYTKEKNILQLLYGCIVHFTLSVHRVLQIPLQICKLLHQLDKFVSQCHIMSGKLTESLNVTLPSTGTSAAKGESPRCEPRKSNEGSSYADEYLSVRLQLAKLRGAYEEVVIRLWQAEQALSSPGALQYLLPDSSLVDGKAEAVLDENTETATQGGGAIICGRASAYYRLSSVFAAMASLSGSSCCCSPTAGAQVEAGARVDASDLLQSMGVLVAALPTQRDFEMLCGSLLHLAAATEGGVTPAQLRRIANSTNAALHRSTGAVSSAEANSETNRSNTTHRDLRAAAHLMSLFEDGETTVPDRKDKSGALSDMQNANIIDIFTTTIPAKVARTNKSNSPAESAADMAVVQRERAHAHLLLRELGQHMRRVHSAAATASQTGAAGEEGGVSSGSGGYALERIRQIVAESDGTGVDATAVRIETEIKPFDFTSATLLGERSHESNGSKNTEGYSKGTEELHNCASDRSSSGREQMHRVGAMLLSTTELRSFGNLALPSVPSSEQPGCAAAVGVASELVVQDRDRQAIFSEMFCMKRVSNEDAFGDDSSDSD